jgi:metal-responsive CopG/Arc/MetJ family transcriptional regulator
VVKEKPKHRITITFDEDVFEIINKMAGENDVSIARVIRYAVDNLLKENKEGHHQQLVLPLATQRRL